MDKELGGKLPEVRIAPWPAPLRATSPGSLAVDFPRKAMDINGAGNNLTSG